MATTRQISSSPLQPKPLQQSVAAAYNAHEAGVAQW